MVDIDSNTALIIAGISAFSAIIGGAISAGANLLIEWQKSKKEAEKALRDKEIREVELRNQAYVKFLSINDRQVHEMNEDMVEEFHPEFAEESVALILTNGSPTVANIVNSAYPFNTWQELEGVKKIVMNELVAEKGVPLIPKGAAYSLINTND